MILDVTETVYPTYIKDYTGLTFELRAKTAEKIESKHGIPNAVDTLKEVLPDPDCVFRSNSDPNRYLYYQRYNDNLYIVAVIDKDRNMVRTAYLSDKIKEGELITWNRL